MHLPVLKEKVIEYLDPKENENFIDCTFGEGGHTKEILKRNGPKGKVLAIEIDPDLYEKGREWEKTFKGRLILKNANFAQIKDIVRQENFRPVHGILFDLGISSWHFEESGRGFSFKKDELLIMRYDKNFQGQTAIDILNSSSEREIEKILRNFGEERFAKNIAREVVKERKKRKIETTFQLVEIIKRAVPNWYQRRKIHFATKTFLALRVFINQELENLKEGLIGALEILESGGRLVVISFHSLEDRIVKEFFRKKKEEGLVEILTKKPVTPSKTEIQQNKRARSAKLRAIKKI